MAQCTYMIMTTANDICDMLVERQCRVECYSQELDIIRELDTSSCDIDALYARNLSKALACSSVLVGFNSRLFFVNERETSVAHCSRLGIETQSCGLSATYLRRQRLSSAVAIC